MENNFKKFLKKNLGYIIFALILWLIAEILLVAPIAYTLSESYIEGNFDIAYFLEHFITNIVSINSITHVFTAKAIGVFGKSTIIFSIILVIALLIGIYKSRDKSKFQGIEHGSSDWCTGGEEYRILTRNSGLILSENHCLPLDKIGNVNVLIVLLANLTPVAPCLSCIVLSPVKSGDASLYDVHDSFSV